MPRPEIVSSDEKGTESGHKERESSTVTFAAGALITLITWQQLSTEGTKTEIPLMAIFFRASSAKMKMRRQPEMLLPAEEKRVCVQGLQKSKWQFIKVRKGKEGKRSKKWAQSKCMVATWAIKAPKARGENEELQKDK